MSENLISILVESLFINFAVWLKQLFVKLRIAKNFDVNAALLSFNDYPFLLKMHKNAYSYRMAFFVAIY